MNEHELPEYLREDAGPKLACDKCGRKSWADTGMAPCGMTQPDGRVCNGVLTPTSEESQ